MNAADVVGYAYDAAMHCVPCARHTFGVKLDRGCNDSEGNPVSPVFCGEDSHGQTCDDCGESLDNEVQL